MTVNFDFVCTTAKKKKKQKNDTLTKLIITEHTISEMNHIRINQLFLITYNLPFNAISDSFS